MKYGIFCIRDELAGFLTPTTEINESVALRNFKYAINRTKDNLLFSNPSDYNLYQIGEFDSDDGTITPCVPKMVCKALSLKEVEKDEV